jgi:hypothetical protein
MVFMKRSISALAVVFYGLFWDRMGSKDDDCPPRTIILETAN